MMNDLGGLLSSIFTGAIGLNQLVGGGGGSVSGSAAAGASAADPFASQRAQYQQTLSGLPGQLQGQIGSAQNAVNPIISQLTGLGGNATMQQLQGLFQQPQQMLGGLANSVVPGMDLQQKIDALAGNYMDNPAIKAQYELGLGSVNRGLAAQGLMGSGQQMAELERYGQQFASQAYQQQFQNLLSGNQQQAALAGQQFSQQAIAQQLMNQMQQQRFGQGLSLQQMLSQSLGQAGQLQLGASGQQLGATGNLLQQMLTASGATTGSPATAGGILSGQFANSQQAAANLGQGTVGALSRLLGGGQQGGSGLPTDSIRKLIDLFNGGGSFAPALASGLGDLFGGAGIFGGSFAGGAGFGIGDTLGSMFGTGSYLPGIGGSLGTGFDLGGSLLGFSEGAGASAGAGTAGAGAAGSAGAGMAALTAAPFAIAIGGMLGGLLGYSDNGTPQTNITEEWASALSSNPQLLQQYGSMENFLRQNGIYPGPQGYSWDQFSQVNQLLGKQAPMGVGWWLGSDLMDNGGG